jgi:hypothetical protein
MNQLRATTEVQSFCYREKRPKLTKLHFPILFAQFITDNKTNNVTYYIYKALTECARGIARYRNQERTNEDDIQFLREAKLTS